VGDSRVAALMTQGRVAEADQEIVRAGTPMEWRIMRALLDGRRNEACAALRLVTKLGRGDRFWFQRFWVALEWGDQAEQGEVLDHSRERAYRFSELPWRAALALHLARLGRHDEASRELQTTLAALDSCLDDQTRLDIVTSLVEAAYLLRDAKAAEALSRRLVAASGGTPFVVVGPGWVCKGSVARFEALAAAARGDWKAADQRFSAAADAHAEIGAQPLVARTLLEWGHTLVAHDAARAHRYIDHGIGIADRLHLSGLAHLAQSPALAS
jgi:tetratricopeptide (TPR) repeat protein